MSIVELSLEPGLHPNLSMEEYRAIRAVNWSTLRLGVKQSWAHARARMEQDREPTDAMRLGLLAHTATLEPLQLLQEYVVMPAYEQDPENLTAGGKPPSNPKATKYYQGKKRQFEEQSQGKMVVTQDEYDRVQAMHAAIHSHPTARRLWERFDGDAAEITAIWIDKKHRCLCKARYDALCDDVWPTIGDLKTTSDASVEAFPHQIYRLGYHAKAAFYLDGYTTLTGRDASFTLAAVESEGPYHGIEVYTLTKLWIQMGRVLYQRLLDGYQACVTNDTWPGYTSDIKEPQPPDYAIRAYEKEMQGG
jgi:hypothetical protein